VISIAFLGLPIAALLLKRDGHRIVYAGVARSGALGLRRLRREMAQDRSDAPIEVLPQLGDPAARDAMLSRSADLLVSWYWVKNVPADIRRAYPLGTIGIHPSLLPRHRGPDPFFWAIDRGDEVTGVTAHRLADEYDTGAVLACETLRIEPRWNAWTLAKKLDRPSLALLRATVARISRGETLVERDQDESRATAAPAVNDDDLELDWTWTTERLMRRIRAASPWPGAFTFIGDDAFVITRVEPAEPVANNFVPGESWVRRARGMAVACVGTGDGALALLEGRDENDREMGPAELAERMAKAADST
jgi:methionyl-tRNA formyltransferase